MFLNYYLICLAYCIYQLSKRWRRDVMDGGLGITPGLDLLMVMVMAWVLAPVDAALTWVRLYKEAEEARRRNNSNNL